MRLRILSPFIFFVLLVLMLAPLYSFTRPASADSGAGKAEGGTVLTLLHNNDGESSILPIDYQVPPGTGYPNPTTVTLEVGSVAAFKTVTDDAIADARAGGNSVVNVYAGDAFLASTELRCSLPPAPGPIYDAVAQRQIAYDAHIIGNHEFDFGPGFLRDFIEDFEVGGELTQPFLSANLDFSNAEGYADLIDLDGLIVGQAEDGRVIAHGMVLTDAETSEVFGIVAATTPELEQISSPGDVEVTTSNITETATVVQDVIDTMSGAPHNVSKVIFVSHLQSVENDKQLIGLVSGVDVAVAGGGDEMLVNPNVPTDIQMLPGELAPIQGDYPTVVMDADGNPVYLVTTAGNYKYLGRLDVVFDANGDVVEIVDSQSYPRRVVPESTVAADLELTDTVEMDIGIVTTVNEPVIDCVEEFSTTLVAYTEVPLDVSRDGVRYGESNAGDLIADSFLYVYEAYSATNDLPTDVPFVAVQNGGGIRQGAGDTLEVGPITRKDTIDVLPFFNFFTAITDVTPAIFKEVMEHSISEAPIADGRFLQVGGFFVEFDIDQPVGSRVIDLHLANGTPIVENGEIASGAPNVVMVTNSFTAGGGDGYIMLENIPDEYKVNMVDDNGLRIDYEGALLLYLASGEFEITGDPPLPTIDDGDPRYQYPDGEGRITIVGGPTAITLASLGSEPVAIAPWLVAAGLLGVTGAAMLVRRRVR